MSPEDVDRVPDFRDAALVGRKKRLSDAFEVLMRVNEFHR